MEVRDSHTHSDREQNKKKYTGLCLLPLLLHKTNTHGRTYTIPDSHRHTEGRQEKIERDRQAILVVAES